MHRVKIIEEVEAHAGDDQVLRRHHDDPLPQQAVPEEGPIGRPCSRPRTLGADMLGSNKGTST